MNSLKRTIDGIIVFYVGALLLIMGPVFLGYQVFAVISGSMQPEIKTGSAVYVKWKPFEELKEGDIVTYRLNGTAVTHRIIEKDSERRQVRTKGDANEIADAKKTGSEQIEGKVCLSLPYLGYLAILFQGPREKAGLLLLLIGLFALQTLLVQMLKRRGEEMDMI